MIEKMVFGALSIPGATIIATGCLVLGVFINISITLLYETRIGVPTAKVVEKWCNIRNLHILLVYEDLS